MYMQPKRVTVWCGFCSRGIIEPFFLENEQGEGVTVNGYRYWVMSNEFLFTNIGNIWYQQDDATCHTAEATLDVLRPVFKDCIISRRADDLTPLDYYLWGAVKDKCYANKPETINALHIHTYTIGHYNSSVRIIDLVFHTTYVVCVNFIHK